MTPSSAAWTHGDDPEKDHARRDAGTTARSPVERRRGRGVGLVLIADDTPDTRELYGLYLNHVGYAVELVGDGLAAVDRATALRPDVIVMDLAMPGLDGITATQRLKGHRRTQAIPVILLTGYPYKAIQRGALENGVDVLLTKPCLPEDLEQRIRQLLSGGSKP